MNTLNKEKFALAWQGNILVWFDRLLFFIVGVLVMLGAFQAYALYRTNYLGEQMAIGLPEFRRSKDDLLKAMTWEDYFQEAGRRGLKVTYNKKTGECDFTLP